MTDVNIYDPGNTVELQVTFTLQDGTLYAPATVRVQWIVPGSAAVVTKQMGVDSGFTNPSTGLYRYDLDADLEGTYHYRWLDPAGKAAGEWHFQVRKSPFVP